LEIRFGSGGLLWRDVKLEQTNNQQITLFWLINNSVTVPSTIARQVLSRYQHFISKLCVSPTVFRAMSSKNPVTAESISEMGVGDLKAYLNRCSVSHADCMEKSDLRTRALQTFNERASSRALIDGYIAMPCLELLPALRRIDDVTQRRSVCSAVHAAHLKTWRSNSKWKGMARHLVEDVHTMFRQAFSSLIDTTSNPKAVRSQVDLGNFQRYNENLHGHHGNEDAAWFPRLKRLHPEFKAEIEILEADHAALVALEKRIHAGDYAALTEFVAALDDHLNREEIISVPFLMDGTGGLG
jgi:iron-sulfur cluster repair protein YtfE (RIC family)